MKTVYVVIENAAPAIKVFSNLRTLAKHYSFEYNNLSYRFHRLKATVINTYTHSIHKIEVEQKEKNQI